MSKPNKALMYQLEEIYEQHRRRKLKRVIGETTAVIRNSLLLYDLGDKLFGEKIHFKEEPKKHLQKALETFKNKNFGKGEALLDETLTELKKEYERILRKIGRLINHRVEQIEGLMELSSVLEINQEKALKKLKTQLNTLREFDIYSENKFEEAQEKLSQTIDEFKDSLSKIQSDILEEFPLDMNSDLMNKIVKRESVTLADLESDTLTALKESKLSDKIRLVLGSSKK